jgi:hypothetical protein
VAAVGRCSRAIHEFVSLLKRYSKSRFLGFIEETHFAPAINSWLLHASHWVFGRFACLHCTPQHAREREEIAQDG